MLPDLSEYRLDRSLTDAPFEGVAVPGLSAEFYHRPDGDRVATVGRYSCAGRDFLLAWGYADEPHCRKSAVHDETTGGWHHPTDGCPTVRVERAGGEVVGLAVLTPAGQWLSTAGATRPGK
ncbi:hypothetical protein [Paractinoplanes atraurantiacus]|uniref:Uncharacterized protein n=1 Tax=Paractinoplanes atraurantiacus TaxID=1036182 RepID=A0A285J480_9ACTN|nr:hypothetical protein [Actinoplanes atraurantiacus]SNY54657.1 hypothetical protein SAMN05421748_115126 [Actinoplanes atraurantiacus]